MSHDRFLAEIADRMAITDLLYRYSRAVDRIDPELGYTIWHEDGIADYGTIYQGSGRGAIDMICDSHRHIAATQHLIGNILIDLDGERAGSEAYFHANMRLKGDGDFTQLSVWGRYIDRWSRLDGRWGIDRRTVLIDMDDARPATPFGNPIAGRQDRDDGSYAALPHYPRV